MLGMLAHGTSVDTLLADYPQLEEADVLACLAYGAKLANGRLTDLPAVSDPAT